MHPPIENGGGIKKSYHYDLYCMQSGYISQGQLYIDIEMNCAQL